MTLVGNDTGGALCQLVAVHHPERLGRLVLTPCDAYDNFLPLVLRPLQVLARVPGAIWVIAQLAAPAGVAAAPDLVRLALEARGIDDAVSDAWLRPILTDRRIRRELATVLKGISKRYTLEAAERFGRFDRPVLIAWAPDDRFFKFRYAERLAAAFPDARLERIEDSSHVRADRPAAADRRADRRLRARAGGGCHTDSLI